MHAASQPLPTANCDFMTPCCPPATANLLLFSFARVQASAAGRFPFSLPALPPLCPARGLANAAHSGFLALCTPALLGQCRGRRETSPLPFWACNAVVAGEMAASSAV
eukprot:GGOE01058779.1.p3 GENE.GGOE01058779.1~~GGOE01058779.1.p3  ORF type:complete len:108 (+),score=4.66 GGOE01058779.1:558-881(+)